MSVIGLKERATIMGYNGDGTVTVKLDETSKIIEDINTHNIGLPIAFSTPTGAFIGGIPPAETPVMIEQALGEWYVAGFIRPDNIFSDTNSHGTGGFFGNLMGDLAEGRLLLQTEEAANRIYLDPKEGILSGDANNQTHQDPKQSIISHTFDNEWAFTKAHRSITGIIKRDSLWQLNTSGNTLSDHNYFENLTTIGMDPLTHTATTTSGNLYRNLPLVESRSIYYELYDGDSKSSFESDRKESDKYDESFQQKSREQKSRISNRTAAFGLNLHYPNHLIEEIKGTGVDVFGNVLDLNRSVLPLGREKYSLSDNEDNIDAFKNIRANHRKAIAYHFEINARKDIFNNEIFEVPSSKNTENNTKHRSTFFLDIDKEGQLKLNVPASSETGNVPLPTRYVNSSVLAYENELISNPNSLFEEADGIDIYLESYANSKSLDTGVLLVGDEGQVGPIDRLKDSPIKLNTTYHDITKAGYFFTNKWLEDNNGNLTNYLKNSYVNRNGASIQRQELINHEIKVSGEGANAGGRSGNVNFDGFISLNIGANTIDRQSMWLDTAGGIMASIGRDLNGVSYCGTLDGDLLVQIGGPGIGSQTDNRFSHINNANRNGALDIRVVGDAGLTIVRIDNNGVSISTPGRLELNAEQNMTLRSNSGINMEAPLITFYHESMPRVIKRNGVSEI